MEQIISIPLTQDQFAIVDLVDYCQIPELQNKWCALYDPKLDSFYAVRTTRYNGKREDLKMHRVVLNVKDKNIFVDHINFDTLDNRRSNLRLSNHQQNMQHSRMHKNNKLGIKGVIICKKTGKYQVQIYHNHRNIYLGLFDSLINAKCAYDLAAIKYYGEFAVTHFPMEEYKYESK